jgi:antitoxin component YwqK of YwqJK toxin-antitoxin module
MICLIFGGQAQILKKTYYDYQKTKPDEVYYVNAQGQKNGLYTKYTYDGAKSVEVTFVNGVVNGPGKEYYTRGGVSKLKLSGSWKNNEKHGQFITYTYVKYGQSYFNIMQNFAFNDKEADIFNTGVQTKVKEETFNNGSCTKETNYHLNGKVFYTANFENRSYTGDYVCYNDKSVVLSKGKIGPGGKMVGLWVIPREENGDCPKDKHAIGNVVYTQKIKFDDYGNIDTNYFSKTYYLSGKLRDSVRVLKVKYQGEYDSKGIWYLCGPNTVITGPYQSFYESGKVQTQGQYTVENGKSIKVGIWKTFDESGNLVNEINEDEIRNKAAEAKKEAERIEKERIEKEIKEQEEKRTKEKRDIAELTALNQKADSCINLEKTLFHTYSISHKNTNPISLDNEFQFIHQSFEYKISELKSQISKDNLIGSDKKKQLYSEMIDLGTRHIKTNQKMIDFENTKISIWEQQKYNLGTGKVYELKASLNRVQKVEDKIRIFENYQLDPK